MPERQTIGSAGMDVCANLSQSVILLPMERIIIPTGLHVELPIGYEIQLRPRSGLAIKNGITLLNTPATIDSDYRGDIGIILINLSNVPFEVNHGDRIAQMVLAKYETAEPISVLMLSDTVRGDGGYGSTGGKL